MGSADGKVTCDYLRSIGFGEVIDYKNEDLDSELRKKKVSEPKNYMKLATARVEMKGIIVFDFQNEYPKAVKDISAWLQQGKYNLKNISLRVSKTFPKP